MIARKWLGFRHFIADTYPAVWFAFGMVAALAWWAIDPGRVVGWHWNNFGEGVVASVFGVLFAATLAVGWLERSQRRRALRIADGVRARLINVRARTARSATILLCNFFPAEDQLKAWDGWYYLRGDGFERARSLLWGEQGVPDWPRSVREPQHVYYLFNRAKESVPLVESTIRIYGPALLEHPELLQALEAFEGYFVEEQSRWDAFWRSYQFAEEDIRRWRDAKMRGREAPEGYPEPKLPVAPPHALMDIVNIGALALSAAIEATRVIGDRDDLPSELPTLRLTTFPWSADDGDRDAPFWGDTIPWDRK